MSGYNSRKIYDNCYSMEFINQQVNPCKYSLFEPYSENNIKCDSLNGPRANKTRASGELGDINIIDRTNIESQLYNLDVPDARCITINSMEEKNKRLSETIKNTKFNYNYCKNNDTLYSRLDIPVNDFRSVNFNTYQYPIINPNQFVYYGIQNTEQYGNQRFGVDTQLQAKDSIGLPPIKNFNR